MEDPRREGKTDFARSAGRRLPPELLDRPKMGFGVPLADWFRGPLREMLRDHLFSDAFLGRGMVSRAGLETLVAQHERRRYDNSPYLWLLLMLAMWFERHAVAAGERVHA